MSLSVIHQDEVDQKMLLQMMEGKTHGQIAEKFNRMLNEAIARGYDGGMKATKKKIIEWLQT